MDEVAGRCGRRNERARKFREGRRRHGGKAKRARSRPRCVYCETKEIRLEMSGARARSGGFENARDALSAQRESELCAAERVWV